MRGGTGGSSSISITPWSCLRRRALQGWRGADLAVRLFPHSCRGCARTASPGCARSRGSARSPGSALPAAGGCSRTGPFPQLGLPAGPAHRTMLGKCAELHRSPASPQPCAARPQLQPRLQPQPPAALAAHPPQRETVTAPPGRSLLFIRGPRNNEVRGR